VAAATDTQLHVEIISYSRALGLFAGIDLSGGILKPDQDANRDLYGRTRVARKALTDGTKALTVAQPFMAALQREYPIALR
jgi:lipid-binding SYLF domain-containing protein